MVNKSDIQQLERDMDSLRRGLRSLTERVYALEHPEGSVAKTQPVAEAAPVLPTVQQPAPPLVFEPMAAPPLPASPLLAPPADQGWEAVLGGSWLNKVGVLVLVVGMALFLWYSFGRMGPSGRIGVACGVSVLMLAGGAVLERREKYRVAARGLIGGGWAALYSTTYAAHAVEAAKVISSPTTATLLLAAVAVGMILHSLRYRSQTVTGLSYFVAFVTLAISPLAPFALVALVPLAVSLLYLAHRFRWPTMALGGLLATYGVYLLHAARSTGGSLAVGQSVLFVYWLVFEWFDVQYGTLVRRGSATPQPVLPFNALGFLLVSLVQWQASSPNTLYLLFVMSAAAYLASTLLRLVLLPVSGFPREATLLDRVTSGGFEGALALAAGLTAAAISLKLSGLSISVAFLVEAELLFFAGLYFKQPFVRHLAAALLGASVIRMLVADVAPRPEQFTLAGAKWRVWSPVALLHAAVFYMNRFLAAAETYYGHAAAGLLMLVLAFELPFGFVALAWLMLAVALYELGVRTGRSDFTSQGFWAGAASLCLFLGRNVLAANRPADWHEWAPQLCGGILFYALAVRPNLPDRARGLASASGTVLVAAFLSSILRSSLMTVAWGAEGVALLLAGFPLRERWLRLSGLGLLLTCVGKLFLFDLRNLELPFRILSFLVLGVLLIGVSFIYSRFRERIDRYL